MWDLYVSIVKTRAYLATVYFVMGMFVYAMVHKTILDIKNYRQNKK